MRHLLDTLSRDRSTRQAIAVFTTVGIDVGGARKGFHAVALTAGAYAGQLMSRVKPLGRLASTKLAGEAPCAAPRLPVTTPPSGDMKSCPPPGRSLALITVR
jgi:hypothetical protein